MENIPHKYIHQFRVLIQSLPIKKTSWRWRIKERNQNIGWNECRLEMYKRIGEFEHIKEPTE